MRLIPFTFVAALFGSSLALVGCNDGVTYPVDLDALDDDGSIGDAVEDTPATVEAALDAPTDATHDAAVDAVSDAKTDAKGDAPADAGADSESTIEAECKDAGGTVTTQTCCSSQSDFPNLCSLGTCTCAPSSSKTVKTCQCPTLKCWNGTTCAGI